MKKILMGDLKKTDKITERLERADLKDIGSEDIQTEEM